MSKVVKGVGRAISKVVKGVTNVVKKVAKSKIGKVLIAAAAIYFGGAALMGAMGTSGAAAAGGLSGLSGAAANVGAAWSSLGSAGSALLGGNLSGAGSALASGFSGGTSALASPGMLTSMGGTGGIIGNGMTQAQMLAAQNAGIAGATELTNAAAASAFPTAATAAAPAATAGLQLTPGAATAAAKPGLIGSFMSSSPYAAPAAIMAGSQLVGGVMQGVGAQQQQKHQEDLDAAARQRYNTNIGTRLWG